MRHSVFIALLPISLLACDGDPQPVAPDATPVDVATDMLPDTSLDQTPAQDATPEVSVLPDAARDAGMDAPAPMDAAPDVSIATDVTMDAPVRMDAAPDASPDVAPDAPAFDPAMDHAALTTGVRTINLGSSTASALVVHGATAFPVVYDANHTTFIAAARAGMGRVIEFGHEGLMYNPRNTTDDRGVLTLNAARWLARGVASPVVGLETTQTELRDFLTANGFTVRTATLADLAAVNVFVVDAGRTRTDAEVMRLTAWVQAGGGLMMGGHAWFWSYSNNNAALNFPGNKVLGPLGLTISSENDPTSGTAVPVRAPTDLDHATRALERVRLHTASTLPLTMADQVIASNVVRRGVRVMDIASDYMNNVRTVRRSLPNIIPTELSPVRPATQPIPALTVTIDTRLAVGLPAAEVTAHPAANDFPGALPAGVATITATQTINATYAGRTNRLSGSSDRAVWRSTGLYAAAGARVTVTVPTTAIGAGLTALIGSWTDDNFSTDAWSRMPVVTRSYPLQTTSTTVASAFGGLIYISVPPGASVGSIAVTVTGAVAAPRFVHGVTTLDEWRNTQRTLPGLYAELESNKLVLTVPSSLVRTLDDPAALMAYWDRVMDADADLAAIDRNRVRAERIVFDRQIVSGFMHAGYPIMAFTPQARESLDLATLRTVGGWGFFHEIGHNHQFADWSWTGTTENTVNIWSVYAMENVVGLPPRTGHPAIVATERTNRINAYITGGRNFARDWSVWTGLETFLQLQQGFGWNLFTTLNREYMALPEAMRPTTESARINEWVTRSCRVANRNLAPFYTSWAFPLTDAARTACAAYPAWAENPMR
jgi:hypothetical protein